MRVAVTYYHVRYAAYVAWPIPGLPQVLLVNLVTSTTLGLALAAEPPEPTVMDQPPRRRNKRLVGKLLLWRMFFVCHVVVVLVLGVFAWAQASGYSLASSRGEAFSVLVGSQVGKDNGSCRLRHETVQLSWCSVLFHKIHPWL